MKTIKKAIKQKVIANELANHMQLKTKLVGITLTNYTDLHQASLTKPGIEFYLKAEPQNPFDRYAVSVWLGNLKMGYICREDSDTIFDLIETKRQIIVKLVDPTIKREPEGRKRYYCDIVIIVS